jgi:hypothetical protein
MLRPSQATPARLKSWGRQRSLIYAIILLAFGLRLHGLMRIPFNIDEVDTISQFVPLTLPEIFGTLHSNNHPLASALAHLFSPQADHLFMLRWPFVLIGLVGLPFFYRLGRLMGGPRLGLLGLALLAVTPVHLGYSMIVRGYGGLITLTIISLYSLARALLSGRWPAWLAFLGANLLIVFFHLFGAVAGVAQLGLVGLGLSWGLRRGDQTTTRPQLGQNLQKLGLVSLVILGSYGPLIYRQATAITTNERWPINDFVAWQDGVFSLSEDSRPLTFFVGMMAPLSEGGLAKIVYFIFFVIGLYRVWRCRPVLAGALGLGLAGPFVAIYLALQLLGDAFYAYVRFLLFLMPVYLLLVAVGVSGTASWLTAWLKKGGAGWTRLGPGLVWAGGLGWLWLVIVSTQWYYLQAIHIDWPGLSRALATGLQPSDITICEEQRRGFHQPDGAKAYCVWMLDYFVPQLHQKSYTPYLQSSTDFVATFDSLLAQRQALLEPGRVWLVRWQKIHFRPDDLVWVETRPDLYRPPAATRFDPYPVRYFGSAGLVEINEGPSQLENIERTLTLLLALEDRPADQARYYRSLSHLAALQGHKEQARIYFEQSWQAVEQAGGEYPALFLAGARPLIERIPEPTSATGPATRLDLAFGPALCLRGYDISAKTVTAGQPLRLELHWQTLDFIQANLNFALQLETETGQRLAQVAFPPFAGTYPTPWWWIGQKLIDRHDFVIPPELPAGDYRVSLSAHPPDPAAVVVTAPLFTLRRQPGQAGGVAWRIEAMAKASDRSCPPVD